MRTTISDLIKVLPQYLLPKHLLSQWMHRFMRIQWSWIRKPTLYAMVKLYKIDLSEAKETDPNAYPHFNALFTRALDPAARPIDTTPFTWCAPVDGQVSQSGEIDGDTLIQAKCHPYSLQALLGGDIAYARTFEQGNYAVIYLSPQDYHRIHMPYTGTLKSMTYVPGDLFAVNPATVRQVDQLFARNERLIFRFDTEQGPFCMIWVGAIFVGSMETVWSGQVTPPYQPTLRHWDYTDQAWCFEKGEEIGRFNMGSTVILLTPPNQLPALGQAAPQSVKMGQAWVSYPQPSSTSAQSVSPPEPPLTPETSLASDPSPKITL